MSNNAEPSDTVCAVCGYDTGTLTPPCPNCEEVGV